MSTFSAVEFLLWLLLAASVVAVITTRLRIPYTVALVVGGLSLGLVHLPIVEQLISQRPDWLTPDVALVVFLPALLFEGSLKIQLRHLRENLVPILLLATLGVFVAALITSYAVHWAIGLPIGAALVFGAIVAPTDPISVLAIFRREAVPKRLEVVVEGESLFNDGTAAVLFGILVGGTSPGGLSVSAGVQEFLVVVLGGVALGLVFGFVISKITERIDDPQIEITLTTIAAYGSFLAAQSLHLSGVIATVTTGLMIGNFGARFGMSPHTRVSLWSFWEYVSFVINSIVFLLIGLQVRVGDLLHAWQPVLLAVGAVLLGRALSVYSLSPVSNYFTEKIPTRWQHVLVAGGLRGSLSLALALGLPTQFPYRSQILAMTFGVVAFTIVVQGMMIRPLLGLLGITSKREDEYDRARVRRGAILSAQAQLDDLLKQNRISTPAYELLRRELDERLDHAQQELTSLSERNEGRIRSEVRQVRARLKAAEKSSIEQALHDGLTLPRTASKMIEEVDSSLEELRESGEGDR
jgi:CPA1 family monovalent cation:H+ antiporter